MEKGLQSPAVQQVWTPIEVPAKEVTKNDR